MLKSLRVPAADIILRDDDAALGGSFGAAALTEEKLIFKGEIKTVIDLKNLGGWK